MHAEFAGLIRGRRNHATLVALAAYDHGLSFHRRVEQLFHRNEERVHIDVEDRSGEGTHGEQDQSATDFTKTAAAQPHDGLKFN